MFSDNIMKHPHLVWDRVNEVPDRRKVNTSFPNFGIGDGINSGKTLSGHFNEYFTGNDISSLKTAGDNFLASAANVMQSFFLCPVSPNEVSSILMNLKNSRSCYIDNIQMRPVKFVCDFISPVISYICNLSLPSGIFPRQMRVAKVIVLYKSGDQNVLKNYRPISVLPTFSKVLEKITFLQLDSSLNKFSLLNDSQLGFRKGRSTEIALLQQKE